MFGAGGVHQQPRILRQGSQKRAHLVVGGQAYAVGGELGHGGIVQLGGIHKEPRLLPRDDAPGISHGIKGHVLAAHVEQPGHIVQRAHQAGLGVCAFQLGLHTLNLAVAALAGIFHGKEVQRILRHGRAIAPDAVDEVFGVAELRMGQLLLQAPVLAAQP
jgi:hypothetical protein